MVERYFDDLRRGLLDADKISEPPAHNENLEGEPAADESFLAIMPMIRQIVWRKLFSTRRRGDAPDMIQKIVFQLLTWRKNNPHKIEELTADQWQSFAAKAAYRAVNRRASGDAINLTFPLDEAFEMAGGEAVAGNTQAEAASLSFRFWQGICGLSLRQRRALLLGSDSLLVMLRFHGISHSDLCEILEVSASELAEIITRVPLPDTQIAHFIADHSPQGGDAKNRNIISLVKSIKKARHEARSRLKKLLSE